MPKWNATDPDTGQTLTLEGDSPPSEQDIDQAFSEYRKTSFSLAPPRAAAPPEAPDDPTQADKNFSFATARKQSMQQSGEWNKLNPAMQAMLEPTPPDESTLGEVGRGLKDFALNIPRGVGVALGLAGKSAAALAGKAMGTGDTFEDVLHALGPSVSGETVTPAAPLPIEQHVRATPGIKGIAESAGLGLLETAPKLALMGAFPQSMLVQSIASGGIFGLDDQGDFSIKGAVIGAILPYAGHLAQVGVAKAIASGMKSGSTVLANRAAQNVIETLGQQAMLDGVMTAADSPDLLSEYKKDPNAAKRHLAEIIGGNLAFALLGVRKYAGLIPTETEQFIVKNKEKYADLADKIITRKMVGKEAQKAIEEAVTSARKSPFASAFPDKPDEHVDALVDRILERVQGLEQPGRPTQPYVPPSEGPMVMVPPEGNVPQANVPPPTGRFVFNPQVPEATPPPAQPGVPNAPAPADINRPEQEHIGAAQRPPVQAQPPQVRPQESQPDSSSGRTGVGTPQQGRAPPDVVPPPLPPAAGTEVKNKAGEGAIAPPTAPLTPAAEVVPLPSERAGDVAEPIVVSAPARPEGLTWVNRNKATKILTDASGTPYVTQRRFYTISGRAKYQITASGSRSGKHPDFEMSYRSEAAADKAAQALAQQVFDARATAPSPAPRNVKIGGVDRPGDIIDDIQGYALGAIGKFSLENALEHNKDFKPTGILRKLFARGGSRKLDAGLDALHREGKWLHVTDEGELLDAMEQASKSRKSPSSKSPGLSKEVRNTELKKEEDFKSIAVNNERKPSQAKGAEPIEVTNMVVGDKFKVAGMDVEVKELVFDPESGDLAYVVLEDGRRFGTQTISADKGDGEVQVIYADKGSVVQKEAATADEAWGIEPEKPAVAAGPAAPVSEAHVSPPPVAAPPRPELPPVPGLNARERDEFQDLSLKARSARESGGPQLTTEETQRYDALLKKAGQMDLLAEDRKSGDDAEVKRLNDKANELRRQQGFSLNRAKRDEVSAYQRQIEAIEKQIDDVRRSAEQGPAAAPEQGGLFSIGAESPSGRMVFAGPPIRLETVEQMRAAIDDPKSQISDEHKAVVKWMLDKGLLQQMPGLKLEVADWIAGGRAVGEYLHGEGSSGLARFLRWSEATTPVHEFFHHVERFISDEDRDYLNALRKKMILAEVPADQRGTFLSGLASNAFVKAKMNSEFYHLINPSEFFTWLMTNKAKEAMATPEANGFVAKISGYIKSLYTAFKDAMGLTAREDAMWRKILSGRYRYEMSDGVKFDKAERKLALAKTKEEFDVDVRRGQLGAPQATEASYRDLAQTERRLADQMGASPGAQRRVQLPLHEEMLAAANGLVGDHSYRELLQAAHTDGERNEIKRSAYEMIMRKQFRGITLRKQLETATAEIRSPKFRNMVEKMSIEKAKAELNSDAKQTFINQTTASAGRILSQLRKLVSLGQMDENLQSQYERMQRYPELSSAVQQKFNDIVDTLATDARGITLLLQGGPNAGQEIFDSYAARIPFRGDAALEGDPLVAARLASEILGANSDLRNARTALAMVMRDIIPLSEFNAAGSKIAQQLLKNPEVGVRAVAKKAASLTDKATRADAAWKALNRSVMRLVGTANELDEAVRLHNATMEDPQYQGHVNAVLGDVGAKYLNDAALEKTPFDKIFFEYGGIQRLFSPTGQAFDIDFKTDPASIQAGMGKLAELNSQISDWLAENPNSPARETWQNRQKIYEATLMSQAVWNPISLQFASGIIPGMKKLFAKNSAFGMAESFFQGLATPSAKMAQFAFKAFDRWWTVGMGGWMKKNFPATESSFSKAYTSHGYTDGTRQDYRLDYFGNIAWEFRNGRDVHTGDVICGRVVTKADIEAVKSQGGATLELIEQTRQAAKLYGAQDVMEEPMVLDEFTGGAWGYRRAMEIGIHKGTTVPHHTSEWGAVISRTVHDVIQARAESLAKIPEATVSAAVGGQDPGAQMRASANQSFEDGMMRILRDPTVFNRMVRGFMEQRTRSIFPTLSPYEHLYEAMVRMTKTRNPDAPRSIDDVLNYLYANVAETPEKIRQTFFNEFTTITERFNKLAEERVAGKTSPARMTVDEKTTSMTHAYSGDMGPACFYDYGWVNNQEMRGYAADAGIFGLTRVNRASAALEQEMVHALDKLKAVGSPMDRAAMIKANQREFFQGKDFVDLQTLENRLSEWRKIQEGFQVWSDPMAVQRAQIGLGIYGRVLGDFISMAVSGPRTAWRISGALLGGSAGKMGLVLQQLGYSKLRAFPMAGLQSVIAMSKATGGTLFGWYTPEKGFTPGVPLRMAMNVPGAVRAFSGAKGSERLWSGLEAAFKDTTDACWAHMKWWQDQKRLGMTPDNPIGTILANMMRSPRSKGGIYPVTQDYPENIFGKMWLKAGDVGYQLAAVPEALIQAASTYFPSGFGYNVNYEAVSSMAGKYMDSLAANARRTFDTYEKLGKLGQFNFDNPKDPRNILAPWEVLPTFWGGMISPEKLPAWARPNASNLAYARDLFASSTDVDLNDLILRYWKRLQATPRDQRNAVNFMAPEETDPSAATERAANRIRGVAARFVEMTHHQVPSNRPYWAHKNVTLQIIAPFLGWSSQTAKLLDTYLGGSKTSKWESRASLLVAGGVAALLAMLWETVGGDTETEGLRLWDRFINHKETLEKTIIPFEGHEEAGNKTEAAQVLVHDATAWFPMVNRLVDSVVEPFGFRGQGSIQAFGFDKLNSFLDYTKGVIKTGDPTYGFARFTMAHFPFSEPFVENLMSREGFQTSRNAIRALEKFGPEELLSKRSQSSQTSTPTELSPYKQALEEAIFSGKQDLVAKAIQAFMAKAQALGKPEPEKLLGQVFQGMNPDRKAFGTLPTALQHADALSRMGDWEKEQVQKAEQNYAAAGAMIGHSANFTQDDTAKFAGKVTQDSGTAGTGNVLRGTSAGGSSPGGGTRSALSTPGRRLHGFGRRLATSSGRRTSGLRQPRLRLKALRRGKSRGFSVGLPKLGRHKRKASYA